MKTKIISEIGINHNGSLDIAKKLIDAFVIMLNSKSARRIFVYPNIKKTNFARPLGEK